MNMYPSQLQNKISNLSKVSGRTNTTMYWYEMEAK